MPRLPESVIQNWDKLKHDLLPFIDKLNDPMLSSDFKKELKKKVEALYGQFDSGLKDKLKKVNSAKTDQDAKAALKVVIPIVQDYDAKVKAKQTEWGTNGKAIIDKFDRCLTTIKGECQKALQALGG